MRSTGVNIIRCLFFHWGCYISDNKNDSVGIESKGAAKLVCQRIFLITSNQRRHTWVANFLANENYMAGILVENKPENSQASLSKKNPIVQRYFEERDRIEASYFNKFSEMEEICDQTHKIPWGKSSPNDTFNWIQGLEPTVIVLFGCSIIRGKLLEAYRDRIINMHLGLSPYYRGSGTNFWPLVDRVPECVGATIHYATLKVDGGRIIGQIRPEVSEEDNSHDLGCKTIMKGSALMAKVLSKFGTDATAGVVQKTRGQLFRRGDFNVEALIRMQDNFRNGMLSEYIADKNERDSCYPISEFNE